MADPISLALLAAGGLAGSAAGGLVAAGKQKGPAPPELPPLPEKTAEPDKAAAELRRRRATARGYASTILSQDLVNPTGLKEKLGQ